MGPGRGTRPVESLAVALRTRAWNRRTSDTEKTYPRHGSRPDRLPTNSLVGATFAMLVNRY